MDSMSWPELCTAGQHHTSTPDDSSTPITFRMVTARYPQPPRLQLNVSQRQRRLSRLSKTRPASRSAVTLVRPHESTATLEPSDSASLPMPRRQRAQSAVQSADFGHWRRVQVNAVDQDAAWLTWLSITTCADEEREQALADARRWLCDRGVGQSSAKSVLSRTKHTRALSFSALAAERTPDLPNSLKTFTTHETHDPRPYHRADPDPVDVFGALQDPPSDDWDMDLMHRWTDLRHDLKLQWSRLPDEVRLKRPRDPARAKLAGRRATTHAEQALPMPRLRIPSSHLAPAPHRWSSSRIVDAVSNSPLGVTGIRHISYPVCGTLGASEPPWEPAPAPERPLRSPRSLKRLVQRASRSLRSVKSLGELSLRSRGEGRDRRTRAAAPSPSPPPLMR